MSSMQTRCVIAVDANGTETCIPAAGYMSVKEQDSMRREKIPDVPLKPLENNPLAEMRADNNREQAMAMFQSSNAFLPFIR
jgi:hypothetical protein